MDEATNGTVTCPECRGAKAGFAVVCGPKEPTSEEMKCTTGMRACSFCKGTGEVEIAVAQRYRKGQELCKRRVRRGFGLTQAQLASRVGINPELLNAMEHGRAEIPADLERRLLEELR